MNTSDILNNFNPNNLFFYIDLDGTLINTDKEHFNGYVYAFNKLAIEFNLTKYMSIIENIKMDNYLETHFKEKKSEIKKYKTKYLLDLKDIKLIPNADKFIDFIINNNINHVVVTNTNREIVESFKNKNINLSKLKNWIVREDYNNPKPNPECYMLAKKMFYRGEQNIVGFENSIHGYNALKYVTSNIVIISDENNSEYEHFIKKQNINIIDNYDKIFLSILL